MTRIYRNNTKVKISKDCTTHKYYLLFDGKSYYFLFDNTYKKMWVDLRIAMYDITHSSDSSISVAAFIEASHKFGDIYEFDTMKELLEYYLQQINTK